MLHQQCSNTKPEEPQGRPVLYHFCDFSNTRTTQLVSILRSLLNQLLTFRPDYKFSNEDERLFDAKQQEGPLNDSAFWYDIKRVIIEVGSPFYLFIDGLDNAKIATQLSTSWCNLRMILALSSWSRAEMKLTYELGFKMSRSCSLTQRFWNRISLSSSGTKLQGLYGKRSSEQGIQSCLPSLNAS